MIFKTDNFQLFNGDCLEIMKDLPSQSVNLILCDLPYGITDCKWDSIIPVEKLWSEYRRIIKPRGSIVLFGAQPFTTTLIASNIANYKYSWYWIKNYTTGFAFANYQPLRKVEEIHVFRFDNNVKGKLTYNPQGLKRLKNAKLKRRSAKEDSVYRDISKPYVPQYTGYPTNVLEFANEARNPRVRLHPTQKPVALLEYLIKTYSNEGETVLDNCMGSGSTGVACLNTNRKFIGIELERKYYEIARDRLQEFTMVRGGS